MGKKFVVGLIGGIASGKSTALNFFKQQGIDCYSADTIAHELLHPNTSVYQAICQRLGNQVVLSNKELNRKLIRQQLIDDPIFKAWLEDLMHPLIQQILVAKSKASNAPYCVLEIPLLKDPKDYQLQRVLCIDCPKRQQIERLIARQLQASEIQGFMRLQIPRKIRLAMADDMIDNNQGIQAFKDKLWTIHQNYLQQAQSNG